MSMLRALSFLGSAAQGYVQGSRMRDEDLRREEDRRFQEEQRARMREQFKREDTLRSDLSTAAAPVNVDTQTQAGPIGSRDVPPPPQQTFTVAGQAYPDQMAAQSAAQAANAPDAQMSRIAQAYAKNGDPMGAMKVKTAATQGKLADLNLDEAQRKHVNQLFDDSLQPLASHDDIAALINKTQIGGATQVRAIPTADGKQVEYVKVNPDGSMVKTGQVFDNSARGLMLAKEALAKAVPLEQKLTTAHQLAVEKQAAEHNAGMLGVAQQNANTNEQYRADQADNMRMQRALEERKIKAMQAGGAAGAQAQANPFPEKADADILKRYTITDPVTGQVSVDGNGMQFSKAIAVAKARANGGDWVSSLGAAYEADARIKSAAGNDPQKVNALRAQYLQALFAPPQAAKAPAKEPPPISGGVQSQEPSIGGFVKDAAGRMANAFGGKSSPPQQAQQPAQPVQQAIQQDKQGDPAAFYRSRMAAMAPQLEKAAQDPDIAALEAQRVQLIKAGNAVAANNAIAQINQIRHDRYGL